MESVTKTQDSVCAKRNLLEKGVINVNPGTTDIQIANPVTVARLDLLEKLVVKGENAHAWKITLAEPASNAVLVITITPHAYVSDRSPILETNNSFK